MKDITCHWSGSVTSIPNGWQLCNGANGAPDLRCKILTDKKIRNFYPLLEGSGLHAFDMGPDLKKGLLSANVTWLEKGVTIAASQSRIVSAAAGGFNPDEGSIEMLVRPSWNYDGGTNHILWDTYGGSNKRFILFKFSSNYTRLFTNDIERGAVLYPWQANTLYHVVLNYGTNKLYINKVLEKTFTAGGLGVGSTNLYIGDHYTDPNWSFKGDIFYFIARDVPLTQSEIDAQYSLLVEEKALIPIIKL